MSSESMDVEQTSELVGKSQKTGDNGQHYRMATDETPDEGREIDFEIESESDDEDDDDVDDDDADDDDEQLNIANLNLYSDVLQRLVVNKYNYDDYLLLVNTAHAMGDLDRIRESCELFARVYPLSPEIWLRWLRIELNIATTDAELDKVHSLFRRALVDYFSPEVAKEYANLATKIQKSASAWSSLLSTYALSFMDGRELFMAYREHCEKNEAPGPEQRAKLVKLFEQELSVPLFNMEDTYVELKVLSERDATYEVDWPRLDAVYAKAKEQMAQCVPFEMRLNELLPHEHLNRATIFGEYIVAAKAFLNDRIVQVLHERMVTECCLNPNCWLTYIRYVQRRDGVPTTTTLAEQQSVVFSQTEWDLCARALRNCTWSPELYVEKMRIAERMEFSMAEVKTIAEESLASGFQTPAPMLTIWLEYLGYVRRSTDFKVQRDCTLLRSSFALAWDSMDQLYGVNADPDCEILQMWGRLEYGPLGDLAKGKELWATVMQSGSNGYKSAMWMEFAHLELQQGMESARKVFRKALQIFDMDDTGVLAATWIRFERCYGKLEHLQYAQRFCETQEKRAKEAAAKLSKRQGQLKRKAPTAIANNERLAAKRVEQASDTATNTKKAKPNAVKTKETATKKIVEVPAVATNREKIEDDASKADNEHEVDTSHDDVTVFVSNLSYQTTAEDLMVALPELRIEHVNIIKSANGNSRGFGYVRLANTKEVKKALAFDRRPINGRPTFISCVTRDQDQRSKFKYSVDLEPTKLFVKGLSFETTKEELETAFAVYGKVKDVRLVCHRTGKPKGLAYVEYEDEKSSSVAIMKMDQTELRGFKISVAMSAPPQKPTNAPPKAPTGAANTLGHGRRAQTTRGDVKPRMSFIPRSVVQKMEQKTPTDANSSSAAAKELVTTAATTPAVTAIAPLKSNADFRKFLTQSK